MASSTEARPAAAPALREERRCRRRSRGAAAGAAGRCAAGEVLCRDRNRRGCITLHRCLCTTECFRSGCHCIFKMVMEESCRLAAAFWVIASQSTNLRSMLVVASRAPLGDHTAAVMAVVTAIFKRSLMLPVVFGDDLKM